MKSLIKKDRRKDKDVIYTCYISYAKFIGESILVLFYISRFRKLHLNIIARKLRDWINRNILLWIILI